jgi:hypothetical protein
MIADVNARQTLLQTLPKNGVAAEIGVWRGNFSQTILHVTQPKTLYLIDPWQTNKDATYSKSWYGAKSSTDMEAIHQSVRDRFREQIERGVVSVVRGPSEAGLRGLPDEHLDFAYVDGDHTFEGVQSDLDLCYAKVKTSGFICGDDYLLGKWWKDGVVRAVNEFIGRRRVRIVMFLDAQFLLQKLG